VFLVISADDDDHHHLHDVDRDPVLHDGRRHGHLRKEEEEVSDFLMFKCQEYGLSR
jgi:hypothetical protein